MAKSILDQFVIGEMPWIIRVYLLLFLASVALMLLPGLTIFHFPEQIQTDIVTAGKEALKVIVGAVIGSLSMAAHQEWGKKPGKAPEADTPENDGAQPEGGAVG